MWLPAEVRTAVASGKSGSPDNHWAAGLRPKGPEMVQ